MSQLPSGLVTTLQDRYALEREIGEGGMATVYLARDLRHNRKVALKVLRPELGAVLGKERFLSEIQVTANLQHPHLLPLFDSGEAEGLLYYVMPFVEGESLRKRLERERQLPVEEAVRIAAAVASALDYAHRHGVVHRDLKPENVLLHEGQPLVADFGIALAVSQAGGARITQTGISLGTPHYMSPEQATGDRVIDARADIYSLGALTYEMLSGDPPHVASTSQAIIAKLLTEAPQPVRVRRPSVPDHVDVALQKALERLPADRFATAGEFAEAITGARVVVSSSGNRGFAGARSLAPGGAARSVSLGARLKESLALLGATAALTAAVIAAVALGVGVALWPAPEPQPLVRLSATVPADAGVGTGYANDPDLAISADGRRIAYVSLTTSQRLYVRALDQLAATPLEGLSAPRTPFFSPDGNWIGYFDTSGNLKRVSVTGGPAVTVRDNAGAPRGASWGADDTIVFATLDQTTGLLRVPASGGVPEVLTRPDTASGELDHGLPEILPGGRAVLFTVIRTGGAANSQIAVLDLASGQHDVLVNGSNPHFAESGHLVYALESALYAVTFDLDRLEVTSDPVPVVDEVLSKGGSAANFALSRTGILAYQAGGAFTTQTLVWVDRQGREESTQAPPRAYAYPRLSPDGTRVALDVRDQNQDVWIWDFARRTLTPLTFDAGADTYPAWTPEGRRIVFASTRATGIQNLYVQAADGTGAVERLTEGPNAQLSYGVTPDGTRLIYRQTNPITGNDLYMIELAGEGRETALLVTPNNEMNGEVSPDGRWLAVQSNESGQDEVYVRPFPNVETGRWQASTGGGSRPLWARDGRELFYLGADGRLTAVSVETSRGTLALGNPSRVFERAYSLGIGRTYDVSPDGQRFLMIKEDASDEESGASRQLVVVLNWFEELKRLVPAGRE